MQRARKKEHEKKRYEVLASAYLSLPTNQPTNPPFLATSLSCSRWCSQKLCTTKKLPRTTPKRVVKISTALEIQSKTPNDRKGSGGGRGVRRTVPGGAKEKQRHQRPEGKCVYRESWCTEVQKKIRKKDATSVCVCLPFVVDISYSSECRGALNARRHLRRRWWQRPGLRLFLPLRDLVHCGCEGCSAGMLARPGKKGPGNRKENDL